MASRMSALTGACATVLSWRWTADAMYAFAIRPSARAFNAPRSTPLRG
jgi:hypothetical protein